MFWRPDKDRLWRRWYQNPCHALPLCCQFSEDKGLWRSDFDVPVPVGLFQINACRVPALDAPWALGSGNCIVLLPAPDQTHCALVICNSEWVTYFTERILNSHRSGYSAVRLLHGWCHVKRLPSRRTFCVLLPSMHQFTVSLYSKSHT